MVKITDQINNIKKELEVELLSCSTTISIEQIRVKYLGKAGLITNLLANIKNFSIEEKKEFAPKLNDLKKFGEESIKEKREKILEQEANAKILKKQNFDVTGYTPEKLKGHKHPYSQFIEEIEDIFISMGFAPFDGPEVETDFFNFTALNIPQNHPARDMHDTFWLDKQDTLLRTHTSTVQIHAMQTKKLPIAGFATGRAFRHEAVDASHDFMFMQCEGIVIDKGITLSHLFATAQTFLQTLFDKKDLDIRIRPGFFPFVEPGVEIDMRCPFCKNGCSVCKKSTWVEVFPGGLIHPNVLRAGNIDPEIYSGFAFGFGLTRLAMLKYGINDIRHFYSGKLKFLEQF
ncbi:MAG: Phenylalanine-tRNA ligase alpha subunit [candidate division TM6 bacterium GW2011_GWF2_28_16]|jgi:phenylalanyl-tRNA synthetase alpha chain|nr:MAG: Phenylalanine-tRNA ligase alpha subunit [candidate division TM6 bacterium GW2011_GWF2_28_16]